MFFMFKNPLLTLGYIKKENTHWKKKEEDDEEEDWRMKRLLGPYKIMILKLDLVKAKVKVKFTLEQATKAHRGSRGIAVFFL